MKEHGKIGVKRVVEAMLFVIFAAVAAANAAGITIHRSFRGGFPAAISEARQNAAAVKAMSEEDFRLETCKLVRALEGELGVQFAVTPAKIDFTCRKVSVVVRSNKASGVLSAQFSRK